MKQDSFFNRKIVHTFIIIFVVIIILLIATMIMLKYHVEGEKNLPFNIKKINIMSTAQTYDTQEKNDNWYTKVLQRNDFFFVIGKNENDKSQDAIKKVTFENFQINQTNENMTINIYRPYEQVDKYEYTDEYKVENSLEYLGGQNTNMETLQINNQGGVIGFSVKLNNSEEYTFDEKIPADGRLLAKVGLKEEDIKFNISFDIIIELESGYRFKANVSFDMPIGNILEDGVGTLEDTKLTNVIFKRI